MLHQHIDSSWILVIAGALLGYYQLKKKQNIRGWYYDKTLKIFHARAFTSGWVNEAGHGYVFYFSFYSYGCSRSSAASSF